MTTGNIRTASWSQPWHDVASPELTAALTSIAISRRLREGQLLYAIGDPGRELYGIRSGMVRLTVITPNGYEGLFGLYPQGSWFGEMSLFDDLPRPTNAYAVGDVEVLVLQAARLRELLDRNPLWYRDFARVICHKLRGALTHIEGAFLPTSVRIAIRLLDLSCVYGLPSAQGLLLNLKLPQEDLARMLGLTRQSVNKELRLFESKGWISLKRGRITLHETTQLQQHILEGGGKELLPRIP